MFSAFANRSRQIRMHSGVRSTRVKCSARFNRTSVHRPAPGPISRIREPEGTFGIRIFLMMPSLNSGELDHSSPLADQSYRDQSARLAGIVLGGDSLPVRAACRIREAIKATVASVPRSLRILTKVLKRWLILSSSKGMYATVVTPRERE